MPVSLQSACTARWAAVRRHALSFAWASRSRCANRRRCIAGSSCSTAAWPRGGLGTACRARCRAGMLRLPLRWVAILYGQIMADLAVTGGVRTARDVLKAMMAGASVAVLASELLANGIERLAILLANLEAWMEEHAYESIAQMRGSMSQRAVAEPAAFGRANFMRALTSFDHRVLWPGRLAMYRPDYARWRRSRAVGGHVRPFACRLVSRMPSPVATSLRSVAHRSLCWNIVGHRTWKEHVIMARMMKAAVIYYISRAAHNWEGSYPDAGRRSEFWCAWSPAASAMPICTPSTAIGPFGRHHPSLIGHEGGVCRGSVAPGWPGSGKAIAWACRGCTAPAASADHWWPDKTLCLVAEHRVLRERQVHLVCTCPGRLCWEGCPSQLMCENLFTFSS